MRLTTTILIIGLLLATTLVAQAGDDAAVKKQRDANYAAFAFQTKDEAALSSLMTDDYTADSFES